MKKENTSEALEVCYKSVQNLFKLGVINENEMKDFEIDYIPIKKLTINNKQRSEGDRCYD